MPLYCVRAASRVFLSYPMKVLLCAAIFSAQSGFGTTVIVLRVKDKVWIAADSMQTSEKLTTHRSACKILKSGHFYWAASGAVSDNVTGFKLSALVDRVKSQEGSLRSKLDTFILESKKPLAQELTAIKKVDPVYFSEALSRQCIWEIVFVGIERRRPTFVWVCIGGREVNGQIILDGTSQQASTTVDPLGDVLLLGESEAAKSYIVDRRSKLNTDPIGVLRGSIVVEELEKPQLVGGEISIVEISDNGLTWIDKGKCK